MSAAPNGGADDRLTDSLTANSVDILNYFARRVGHDDAPDLVAETMMAAWRRSNALPSDPDGARMWLFGIARNVLANADRSHRRRLRLANRLRLLIDRSSEPAADAGIEIRDALQRLPAEHAEILRLVHWDGFSLQEASMLLNEPPTTTRSRYTRAKTALRGQLEHPPDPTSAVVLLADGS